MLISCFLLVLVLYMDVGHYVNNFELISTGKAVKHFLKMFYNDDVCIGQCSNLQTQLWACFRENWIFKLGYRPLSACFNCSMVFRVTKGLILMQLIFSVYSGVCNLTLRLDPDLRSPPPPQTVLFYQCTGLVYYMFDNSDGLKGQQREMVFCLNPSHIVQIERI